MAFARPNDIAGSGSRKTAAFIPQLSRYSAASIVALAIDFAIYLCLCALAVNAPVAGVVGYAVGMIAHYVLSSTFVFDVTGSEKSTSRRAAEFAVSGVLGLILTGLVITVMTERFGASAVAAKAAATVVSFVAVFLARRWIVFAPTTGKKNWDPALVYSKSGSSK